jgi:hypothetical protein
MASQRQAEIFQAGSIAPATVVVGDVGTGKWFLLRRANVPRPLILRDRRVVALGTKANNAGGEGERAEVMRSLGGEPIKFSVRGGGAVLNPLDPRITDAQTSAVRDHG